MNTEILKVDRDNLGGVSMAHAGEIIRSGGLVAFPTETVYGLGGDALNPKSSKKIYEAKGRPSDNPLIVHIADLDAIRKIAILDESCYEIKDIEGTVNRLAEAFWPGPLTIILKKTDAVPYETTGGLDTVAIRMPSDKIAAVFIRESCGYIAAPSANISGRPSPTKVSHVIEDLSGRVDMIIDGGDVDIGLESTIVDLTEDIPYILRPGAVTEQMLRAVIPDVTVDKGLKKDSDAAPKAPGMKYRHYAPKGELTIVIGDIDRVIDYINDRAQVCKADLIKCGVICPDEHILRYKAPVVKCAGRLGDEEAVAKRLYSILREFDAEGVEVIYSESFDSDGIGSAVMNRLIKAAGHKIVQV